MKPLKLIAILLLLWSGGYAQDNEQPKISGRKIEVVAYSSEEVLPNAIYTSFVLTEYKDNSGKVVSIDNSVEKIKKLLTTINHNQSRLSLGNVYGYLNTNEKGEEVFDHKVQYILKLDNVESVHMLLDNMDKRALQSFNIDEMTYDGADSVLKNVQIKAFKRALDKADVFLKLYNEKRGRLIEIEEVNRFVTMPDFTGKGASVKSVHASNGISSFEINASRSKYIKIEYVAKVVFEIK